MRHIAMMLGAMAAVMPVAAQAAAPAAEDRTALERLASAADQAWDRGDAEAIASYYVEDANLRLSSMEEPLKGRAALQSYFTQSFAKRPKGLRHVTMVDHIEMLRPDLAFSDAKVRVERDNGDGTWTLVREYQNNSVAMRQGKAWKLATVRAVALPSPAAPAR